MDYRREIEADNYSANEQVFAFTREKNSNKLFVVMNLSDRPVVCDLEFDVQKVYEEVWGEDRLNVGEKESIELQAWEYRIYTPI